MTGRTDRERTSAFVLLLNRSKNVSRISKAAEYQRGVSQVGEVIHTRVGVVKIGEVEILF
ncbi:hypothetical protein [Archaeoglobus sp.]